MGPEDLGGYYSPIANTFVVSPDTFALVELHEASVDNFHSHEHDPSAIPNTPFLLLEEMNLSPPEGYLAPVIHGLSATWTPCVKWPLHETFTGVGASESTIGLPGNLLFGPFPRVLGTINVDATAPAPARKVVARSCVILLEAEALPLEELTALILSDHGSSDTWYGSGSPWLGAPSAIRDHHSGESISSLLESLRDITDTAVGSETGSGSPDSTLRLNLRDVERSMNYMTSFVSLARAHLDHDLAELMAVGAENALLHFVLPGMSPEQFPGAVAALAASDKLSKPTAEGVGGLLASRARSIGATFETATLYDVIDFWTALS